MAILSLKLLKLRKIIDEVDKLFIRFWALFMLHKASIL